jgi:cytochrome c-type biogenesis protein CcmH|tara:strand:- start:275 stop:649 length:375 start_codon:yes stop_codon:yes gene_type:complete
MKKIFIIFYFIFCFQDLSATENIKLEIKIHKNLRCLVCQGQSVGDSNSDFAQTIKLVVKDQINSGSSEKEIYKFLTSKYGEWIVYQPTFNENNFLLWTLPYIILIFGGFIIFLLIRKTKYSKDN